jgi:phage gpG-like protein
MQQPSAIQFKANAQQLKQRLLSIPVKVGDTAILFTMQRFREQAWINNTTEPWKQRKPGAKRNQGRAILMNTGRLRRSIRIVRVTSDSVTIGSDVPYAQVHNDGFKGTVAIQKHKRTKWIKSRIETGQLTKKGNKSMRTITTAGDEYDVRAHSRKMNMPRRRFMGESPALTKQITRLITAEIMKAFK